MSMDFTKYNNLVPVVVQHAENMQVLMLGFMNHEAYEKTKKEGKVTFFSRSRQKLWTKGETSGNFLIVKEILEDCDKDTLLIKALPKGPVCHTGSETCFGEKGSRGTLYLLENIIDDRISSNNPDSYTNKIFRKGINKVAQKVGEEAVELVIEAKDDNLELFKEEAADLMYHYLILLRAKNIKLKDVENVLMKRMKA
jgi:phosphoribosyl-AMP cyclohydrolase / phosphoribosyl-ATP pyrophosphohydrolase